MRKRLGATLMILGIGLAVAGPAAAAQAEPPFDGLEYVALGDSYSAGFGLLPLVSGSPDGCYRAEENYPHRIAAELGLELTDMTCSGAVTANIDVTGQTTMNGVGPLPLQGSALSATTDIVTLTIGGNDLGFATVAETCVKLAENEPPVALPFVNNCKEFYNPGPGTDSLITVLNDSVVPALNRVFGYIAAQAPNAKVFVLGYPQIAPDDIAHPDGCFSSPIGPTWPDPPFPQDTVPFSAIDLHYLHGIEGQLDDAIEVAADAQGFTFLSTWDATDGHTLCDGDDSYIFGVGLTNDPDAGTPLIGDLYVTLGALHPNLQGVPFLENEALAAIRSQNFSQTGQAQLAATGIDGAPLGIAGLGIAFVGLVLLAARRRARPVE